MFTALISCRFILIGRSSASVCNDCSSRGEEVLLGIGMAFEDVEEFRSSGLDNRQLCLVQTSDSYRDLYGELQNTAERFKQLADKLQKTASKKDLRNDKKIQTNDCCEENKTKLMEYIAENLRLRQNLKDVSDINHRWQEYNCDRQKHVQHLQSTVLELRRTIDEMKQQHRKLSSTLAQESEIGVQFPSAPCQTTCSTKQTCHKLITSVKDYETNESDNQCALLNEKLSREVRVLSRQLKEARNESKALKVQLEKVTEENDTLKTRMKTYKSDWEDENKKKIEALSEAQRVVQELCMLKVNCQQQAERLMKMCTVSFNCSFCQGTQNTQKALNNLNLSLESEQSAKKEQRARHKKPTQTATIIQSVDGIEVHLQERCSGATTDKKLNSGSQQIAVQKELEGSTNPIVTFPDSDSEELMCVKEPSIHSTASQHLVCPVCNKSFLKECGSQFLDHYTTCKFTPEKPVS